MSTALVRREHAPLVVLAHLHALRASADLMRAIHWRRPVAVCADLMRAEVDAHILYAYMRDNPWL